MSQPLNRTKASELTLAPISTSRQGHPIAPLRRLKPAPTPAAVAQSHTSPLPTSATQLTTLEQRFLAFPSRPNTHAQPHPNNASLSQPLRLPAIEGQTSVQAMETVLNVFHERIQTDFRDFRSLCVSLVSQEQQAKDNWHKLCLKLMQERDVARQRVHALISEREMRNGKLPPSDTAAAPASSSGKRSRDEDDAHTTSNVSSKSSEPRRIRGLRTSPVSSAGSSASSSGSSSPPPITPKSATLPPDSAISTMPLTPFSTISPMSDLPPIPFSTNPVPEFCKIKPAKSPGDSTSIDCTAVGARPQKRRKSCADAPPQPPQTTLSIQHSPSPKHTDVSLSFSEMDIMYAPLNDHLACRPCL